MMASASADFIDLTGNSEDEIDLTSPGPSSPKKFKESSPEQIQVVEDQDTSGHDFDHIETRYETSVCNERPCFNFENALKPTEALDLLINLSNSSKMVCTSKPIAVTKPATFVVSNKSLNRSDDIKADDLGVWVHKGKPIRRYEVARAKTSGAVYGASLKKQDGANVYKLTRVYYHHKHTPSFRRTLFYASDADGKMIPLTIVQYTFLDGVVVPVKMAPHGNSKNSSRPYYRTQNSTLEDIKENLPSVSPKQIVQQSYEKVGGVLEMKSSGEVSRNRRQVYNMKSYQGSTSSLASNCEKDLVYDLLEQHYSSEQDFVRSVSFEEGVMSVVGSDQQFVDICRFCSGVDPVSASVLGIDPTFNLGDFYVTPTVYEQKLLKNRVTGKHPIFIGPTLIHQDRKAGTYHYFASQIRKIRPQMEGLVAFGTDGEEALSSAFSSVFPQSTHLLCYIHKKDNITRKLREFGIKEASLKVIVNDIFGSKIANCTGLIDSDDYTDFSEKLEMLKDKWDSICPEFLPWFVKHEVDAICSSMLSSVRTQSGLGKPPELFTTNASESLNNLLKRKVDFKRSEWPQFNKTLKELSEAQQGDVEKAVFGGGEYEFISEFKHLEVPHSGWTQMTADQRKLRVKRTQSATLDCLSVSMATTSASEEANHSRLLSIDVSQAKVEHVTRDRMVDMWDKASVLLSTPDLLLPAAGAAGAAATARQVASLSSYNSDKTDPPHFVSMCRRKVGVEVKCDCPVFRSTPNICQHALATAEDLKCLAEYLQWVRKTKRSANLSRLIADAIPKTGGQKSTSRRKGGPKRSSRDPVPQSVPKHTPSPSHNTPHPSLYATPPIPQHGYSLNSPQPHGFSQYPHPAVPHSFCSPSYQINSPVYASAVDMSSSYVFGQNQESDTSDRSTDSGSEDHVSGCAMDAPTPFAQTRL